MHAVLNPMHTLPHRASVLLVSQDARRLGSTGTSSDYVDDACLVFSRSASHSW